MLARVLERCLRSGGCPRSLTFAGGSPIIVEVFEMVWEVVEVGFQHVVDIFWISGDGLNGFV